MHSLALAARWSNCPGKGFDGENYGAADAGKLAVRRIGLRLAEHRGHALLEQLVRDSLHVVAVQQAQAFQTLDLQDVAEFAKQLLGFHVETGLLFNVNPGDHFFTFRSSLMYTIAYCTCVGPGVPCSNSPGALAKHPLGVLRRAELRAAPPPRLVGCSLVVATYIVTVLGGVARGGHVATHSFLV